MALNFSPSIVVPEPLSSSVAADSVVGCEQLSEMLRAFLNSLPITENNFSGGDIEKEVCSEEFTKWVCPVMFRSTKVGYINVGLLVETEHINLTYRRTEDIPSCNIGEDVFAKVHLMFGVYQKLSNIIQAKVDQADK